MIASIAIGHLSMHQLHRGLLFPSTYLENSWFLIALSFVAINTLIYLGLTLAKLLPRPKPRILKGVDFGRSNMKKE